MCVSVCMLDVSCVWFGCVLVCCGRGCHMHGGAQKKEFHKDTAAVRGSVCV